MRRCGGEGVVSVEARCLTIQQSVDVGNLDDPVLLVLCEFLFQI